MFTLKNFHDYDIIETFYGLYNLIIKPREKYKARFFDKILTFASQKQRKYSFPLKIRIINEVNSLLSCSDDDITRATAIFRNIDQTVPPEKHTDAGHFKNLRTFWRAIARIFANDPQIKDVIHWDNPGIDQPVLKVAASEQDHPPLTRNEHNEIIFAFIPEYFTQYNIQDMFPRLSSLGASSLGEDADTFGDTLAEVIQDCPKWHNTIFNQKTIRELRTLLSYTDEDIARVSSAGLIGISPTEVVEEPPNWGHFPTLRAFWTAVLESFEHYAPIQEAQREREKDALANRAEGRKATKPVNIVKKTRSGMTYYRQTSTRP